MSAAPVSTVGVTPRVTSGSSVIAQTGAEPLPATDTLWCEVYHVIEQFPAEGDVQLWKAHRTDTAKEVVLRVLPGTGTEARQEAWARMCAIELPHLQRAYQAQLVEGHRVEVVEALRGTPLNVWRAGRPSVDVATVEAVVRQLAEALGVLHASGLVHLGLRPEVIFVREEKGALHCTLAGLETVTRFEGDQFITARVDPLYAPPEAAGLLQHESGPTLCAWDWWSLGRVAQELILGRHVVDALPDAVATESAPDRIARAEKLLFEHAAKGLRAGAVEVMVDMDPRLDLLLHGLLSSAPEARWGGEFVDRWVRQKPVKAHYTVPRTEQKFRWRGRLYTVAAAAKEFRSAELWAEAGKHIFEPDSPGTLANFIRRASDQQLVWQKLTELLQLTESEPLRSQPPAVGREVLLTLALLQLVGANLLWRGRRLDGESLRAFLAEEPENQERFAFARVMTNRTITLEIDRCDFEAGRSLTEIGRMAADAEAVIKRHGWLKGTEASETARIFRLTLEPVATLQAARERLQKGFACANQPAMEKIFKNAKPSRVELVVLAWVEPAAAACGFVTHADWEAKQLQDLRARSGQFVGGLFWGRLGRALGIGPGVFGGWFAFAACWGTAALLVALLWPGPKWLGLALAPALLAAVARAVGSLAIAGAVRDFMPGVRPWKWTDGGARCRTELDAVGKGLDAVALEKALGDINAGIAKLTLLSPPPAPIAGPPRFEGLRVVAISSWVVLAGILAVAGWRGRAHPLSWTDFRTAWISTTPVPQPASGTLPGATPGSATVDTAAGATGIASDGAAGAAATATAGAAAKPSAAGAGAPSGPVKVSWPYKPGDDAPAIGLKETLTATSAQNSYALKRGREIVGPFRTDTINTLIIIDVPVGDKVAVMVFDGVKDAVVTPRVFILEYRPFARSWIDVGGNKGIYIAN